MRRSVSGVCLIGLLLLAAASPTRTRDGALEGLRLAGTLLVPALLPMSVLANCLLLTNLTAAAGRRAEGAMRRLFRLPGQAAAPLVLGLLGGYPLGALVLAAQLSRGELTKEQGRRLSCFCSNPGPGFLLGAVGLGVFGSVGAGLALLGCSAAAALGTGLCFSRRAAPGRDGPGPRQLPAAALSPARALGPAVERSALAMLRLTAAVSFFSALYAAAEPLLPLSSLPDWAAALAVGSLELSGGVLRLAGCARTPAFVTAAFLSGFGELCVQLQSAGPLAEAGLALRPALLGSLCKGLLCALLAVLCVRLGLAGL